MINKKNAILLVSALICISKVAMAEESKPIVSVQKAENTYTISAKGYGSGTTLDSAKFAAINSILPQLVNQTIDMPNSIQSVTRINGDISGQGADLLTGKTLIQGYWEIEDGVYHYTIELMIKNDNVQNEKE